MIDNIKEVFAIEGRLKTLSLQNEFLNCQLCLIEKSIGPCPAHSYICEMKELSEKEYNSLCKKRLEIYKNISNIDDKELRTILEYRFVYKMTYQKIAEITNYSLRQVMRKIHDACELFSFLS
jgi:DNA-directed RNA polymerase specialized sigma subunit